MDFWTTLFDTSQFTPTSNSFGASPNLLAWYLVMTGIIAASYFCLAAVLISFGRTKSVNLWDRHKWVFILFAAFLASRGCSAAMQIIVAYYPILKVQTLWANFAAFISLTVVIISFYIFNPMKEFVKNMTYFIEAYISNSQIKARYKAVADLLPNPVFVADKEGQCIYVNKAYEVMVGGKFDDDIRGDRWTQFIHEEDRGRLYNQWEDFVNSKKENLTSYARFVNRDGDIIPIKISSSYLPTDYGYVGYIQRLD